jgi:hypothetical protein
VRDSDGKTPVEFGREDNPSTAALIEQFIAPIKSANLMV